LTPSIVEGDVELHVATQRELRVVPARRTERPELVVGHPFPRDADEAGVELSLIDLKTVAIAVVTWLVFSRFKKVPERS
jgi:hypothetical protein